MLMLALCQWQKCTYSAIRAGQKTENKQYIRSVHETSIQFTCLVHLQSVCSQWIQTFGLHAETRRLRETSPEILYGDVTHYCM